jgi:hypothetical protein
MRFKNSLILIISLIFLSSIILGTAMAGDESNPEIRDDTGEEPGSPFRDIDSAWFEENNVSIIISLKMDGSPPGLMDLANQQDTTVYEYEVYFDVEGVSYSVCAIVQYAAYIGEGTPLGGVYSTSSTWTFELREINYAIGTDIIQSETTKGDVADSDYHGDSVVLEWEVSKESIGIGEGKEGRGKELTKTWAAVWNADSDANPPNAQRNPATQAVDYANTHYTDPGRSYRITGYAGIDYNIVLSIENNERSTFGGTPAEFRVNVQNNGTHNFEVIFFTSEPPEDWIVVLTPNSTTIARGATRPLSVTITPPKEVSNGTVLVLNIEGNIKELEGNGTVPIAPPLSLRVIGLSPPDDSEEGQWWENLIDTIQENLFIVGGAIAIVIIAIIILVVLIKR